MSFLETWGWTMKKTRQRGEDANITTACPPKQDADLDHAFLDGRAEGLVIFPDVHQSLKGVRSLSKFNERNLHPKKTVYDSKRQNYQKS